MAINQFNFSNRDIEDLADSMSKMLSSSTGIYELVDNSVSHNNYDNSDFDELLQYAINVFEFMDIKAESEDRDGPFGNKFNDNVKTAIQIAAGEFINADNELYADLSNAEADKVDDLSGRYSQLMDVVERGEMPSNRRQRREERRRDRGRDRGRERGRNNDSVEVHRNRPREERKERGARNNSRRDSSNRAEPQYANPQAEREERKDRESRDSRRNNNKKLSREERSNRLIAGNEDSGSTRRRNDDVETPKSEVYDARKSPAVASVKAGTFKAKAFDTNTHGLYHIVSDNEVLEVVTEKDENMEPYSLHELGASPFNNGSNGKIIPTMKLKDIPPMGDDVLLEANPIIKINDPLVIIGRTFGIDVTSDMDKVVSDAQFTLTPVTNLFNLVIPTEVLDKIKPLSDNTTFMDWLKSIREIKSNLNSHTNRGGILSTFLTIINKRLTSLVNQLLAMVVDSETRLTHFYDDYESALAWLEEPEQAQEYTAWCDCERQLLVRNLSVKRVSEPKVEDGEEGVNGVSIYTKLEFSNEALYVNSYGEMPLDSLHFSERNQIADITFAEVPEFYVACERMVTYRNNHMKMAQIIFSDSFDNNYVILAAGNGASRIRALQQ